MHLQVHYIISSKHSLAVFLGASLIANNKRRAFFKLQTKTTCVHSLGRNAGIESLRGPQIAALVKCCSRSSSIGNFSKERNPPGSRTRARPAIRVRPSGLGAPGPLLLRPPPFFHPSLSLSPLRLSCFLIRLTEGAASICHVHNVFWDFFTLPPPAPSLSSKYMLFVPKFGGLFFSPFHSDVIYGSPQGKSVLARSSPYSAARGRRNAFGGGRNKLTRIGGE